MAGFSDGAMRALLLHEYPGNVRELENLIQRAVVLARGPLIRVQDFPELAGGVAVTSGEPRLAELLTMPMEQAVRELERILIDRALVKSGGNKTEAAGLLQIRRQQLYVRMAELGIE
jgi:two-component system, NtrC family, response regulator AtoC